MYRLNLKKKITWQQVIEAYNSINSHFNRIDYGFTPEMSYPEMFLTALNKELLKSFRERNFEGLQQAYQNIPVAIKFMLIGKNQAKEILLHFKDAERIVSNWNKIPKEETSKEVITGIARFLLQKRNDEIFIETGCDKISSLLLLPVNQWPDDFKPFKRQLTELLFDIPADEELSCIKALLANKINGTITKGIYDNKFYVKK